MTFTSNGQKMVAYQNHLCPSKQKSLPTFSTEETQDGERNCMLWPSPKWPVAFGWETSVTKALITCHWHSQPEATCVPAGGHHMDTTQGLQLYRWRRPENALGMQDRPWGTLYVTVETFHHNSAKVSRTKPQSSKKTIYNFSSLTQISNIKWDREFCEQQLVGGTWEAPQLDKCKLGILLLVQDAWRPKPYANFINPSPTCFKWISDHQSGSIVCTVLNQCLENYSNLISHLKVADKNVNIAEQM